MAAASSPDHTSGRLVAPTGGSGSGPGGRAPLISGAPGAPGGAHVETGGNEEGASQSVAETAVTGENGSGGGGAGAVPGPGPAAGPSAVPMAPKASNGGGGGGRPGMGGSGL